MSIYEKMSQLGTHYSFGESEKVQYIRAVLCDESKTQITAKDCYWNDYRILLLFEGEGSYKDDENNSFLLKTGSLLQRLPFHNHSIFRSESTKWYEFALVISGDLFVHLEELGIIDKKRLILQCRDLTALKHQILRFMKLLRKCRELDDSRQAIVETIIFFYYLFSLEESKGEIEQKIDKASRILLENLALNPHMPEIARCVGLGYHSFRKYFKAIRGISPKDFLLRARIDRAVELMSLSNMSLGEVAFELGYPDFATFAKQFKKRMGVSPGKFRT